MKKVKKLYIIDEKGGMSMVTIADVNQSNGVIHMLTMFYYQKVSFFLLVLFERSCLFPISGL
jgi:hypothetical protein